MGYRLSLGPISLYGLFAIITYAAYLLVFGLDTAFVFVDVAELWRWTVPILLVGLIASVVALFVEVLEYARIPESARRHGLLHLLVHGTLFGVMLANYALYRMGELAPVGEAINWGWGWSMTGAALVVVLLILDYRVTERAGDQEPGAGPSNQEIEFPV